jgi:CheY-like chemotaxis protein
MSNDAIKVFISYSSTNEDFADLVKEKLEKSGVDVWKASDKLLPGLEWRREIDTAIINSDIVLVIYDNESSISPYVTYEWAFALGNGKVICPLLVEECKMHPRIGVLQYIDFKDGKRPWSTLINTITKLHKTQKSKKKVTELTSDELEKRLDRSKAHLNKKVENQEDENDRIERVDKMAYTSNIRQNTFKIESTILWVDDHPEYNIFVRESLKEIGFSFDLAISTNDALRKFQSNTYVAIISDMKRKEGSREGYILLCEIRKIDKRIPFFIFAESILIEHKIEAQRMGAQGSTDRVNELIYMVKSHCGVL